MPSDVAIWYADGSKVVVSTKRGWDRAASDGIQVVVKHEAYPDALYPGWTPWAGSDGDRQLWTGDDEYVQFGGKPKRGSLISEGAYFVIWQNALKG